MQAAANECGEDKVHAKILNTSCIVSIKSPKSNSTINAWLTKGISAAPTLAFTQSNMLCRNRFNVIDKERFFFYNVDTPHGGIVMLSTKETL